VAPGFAGIDIRDNRPINPVYLSKFPLTHGAFGQLGFDIPNGDDGQFRLGLVLSPLDALWMNAHAVPLFVEAIGAVDRIVAKKQVAASWVQRAANFVRSYVVIPSAMAYVARVENLLALRDRLSSRFYPRDAMSRQFAFSKPNRAVPLVVRNWPPAPATLSGNNSSTPPSEKRIFASLARTEKVLVNVSLTNGGLTAAPASARATLIEHRDSPPDVAGRACFSRRRPIILPFRAACSCR
jgi:hypothetical protein